MEINKELVLSTAHISKDDSEVLQRSHSFVHDFEYGWRLYTGIVEDYDDADGFVKDTGLSAVIFNLLMLARQRDCLWLVLDCDGPIEADLPVFKW